MVVIELWCRGSQLACWVLPFKYPDGRQRAGNARAQVFAAVTRHVDWGIVRCLVIAGPGFTKDHFRRYLDEEAVRRDVRCCPATKTYEP